MSLGGSEKHTLLVEGGTFSGQVTVLSLSSSATLAAMSSVVGAEDFRLLQARTVLVFLVSLTCGWW